MTKQEIKKKFPIGCKVIPHSKTMGTHLSNCKYFRKMKEYGRNYLYVVDYHDDDPEDEIYDKYNFFLELSHDKGDYGNFYAVSDVELLIEDKKTKYLFE